LEQSKDSAVANHKPGEIRGSQASPEKEISNFSLSVQAVKKDDAKKPNDFIV
jgi:hypothetical protein